jgi:hypothetical protein
LVLAGSSALIFVAAASYIDLELTNRRCTPEVLSFGERAPAAFMLEVRVSGYCRALHAVHVINWPATGLGGGALEGIFLVPVAIAALGLLVSFGRTRIEPLKRALYVSGAACVLLLILAGVAASTASRYPPGP